ncbi:MAG: DUF2332 family protein [Tabrizicola sp.]
MTIRQAFRQQATACAGLGSPIMERLMTGLANRLEPGDPVADRVLGWPGDPSSKSDSVPLRLAGGLHALILTDKAPALAAACASGIARTRTALDLATQIRPQVDRADAADWLETRLAPPEPGALHLVFHTVAWQYFPTATRARALRAIEAGSRHTPIAHFSMEADGAALTLTLWPCGETIPLGRADFHGR